jgi:regulator of protease activity HflC (stomatin/prohibitin superfamily)
MPKDSEARNHKTRLFPIILLIIAVAFIYILNWYKKCAVIASLGSLTFTMSLFLVLIIVFYEINRYVYIDIKKNGIAIKQKILNKIIWLYNKYLIKYKPKINKEIKKSPLEAEKTEKKDLPQSGQYSGLIEIKKENVFQRHQEGLSLEKRICAIVYILSFSGIAFWRVRGVFRVIHSSYAGNYHSGIVEAVLLLILPCIAILYLKMIKDRNSNPIGKFSRDILIFFSYISFFYAAVIAASSVLKFNTMTLAVLQWVNFAASIYFIAAFLINILLSILKGNVLSFDYTLFPKKMFSKEQFTESTEKWKVSLKSLYTIHYFLKVLPALALALIFVLFLSTCIFVVQPHQQSAVYRFGKLNSIKDPGLCFKFPWPIDKAEIYDVRRVASMQIGYESSGTANFLWTQKHDIGEYMLLLGDGNELVAVNLKILYVISDLYSYIKTYANAGAMLSAAAYNALMIRTINTTLDSFLNVDRNSLSTSVLDELSVFCEKEKLGFSVVQVIIESIHPPVDIADVYQKVVSASIDKTTTITKAQSYSQTKVIEAAKQSKFAIDGARAKQHDRTSDARKEAAVFYAATEAHRISPDSYELAKRLDVYQKIISGHKLYVFSRGAENSISKFIIGKVNTANLLDANKGEGNE